MTNTNGVDSIWPHLQWRRRTVLAVDVVESVRLMRSNESQFIERWLRLVDETRAVVLKQTGGRLVKSLGDGMLLEFERPQAAIDAALQLQQRAAAANAGVVPEAGLFLRIGAHVSDIAAGELDIYGVGVNLAARLCALGEPGDIVVSAEVRDELTADLDASVEDMGECYLKHIDAPQRAFRVSAGYTGDGVEALKVDGTQFMPAIAVIPLRAGSSDAEADLFGELVCDGVVARLSRQAGLRVISRLSSAVLKGHAQAAEVARKVLQATYAMSGSCRVAGSKVIVNVELADLRTQSVLWAQRFTAEKAELLASDAGMPEEVAHGALLAMLQAEATRIRTMPYATLENFSLLLGSISLLHRASDADFGRAHDALSALIERAPRHASGHAWKAKWHFLRVIRGLSPTVEADAVQARQASRRAVECDPLSSLALTYRGLVCGFLDHDLDSAGACYAQALTINPSEAMAWLFTGTLRSWQGRGAEAAQAAERALALSPLDPLRYYYRSLAAAAMLADGQLERAIELAQASLRENRLHTATHRVLAIAQMLAGDGDGARATVQELMRLEPRLTVSNYLERYPGRAHPHAAVYGAALADAGLPR